MSIQKRVDELSGARDFTDYKKRLARVFDAAAAELSLYRYRFPDLDLVYQELRDAAREVRVSSAAVSRCEFDREQLHAAIATLDATADRLERQLKPPRWLKRSVNKVRLILSARRAPRKADKDPRQLELPL